MHCMLKNVLTLVKVLPKCVNSSPPGAAYMRQWTGTALVQLMVCRLFSPKPLFKPMLVHCQLDDRGTNFSEILIKILSKMHLKASSTKMTAILYRRDESTAAWIYNLYLEHVCAVLGWHLIPPFHWATIRSRSKPIWKSGPIGNKRELNGSDCKLSGNERQRCGVVGKVGGDLWTCSKIAPDLRGSGTGRRSSVRSVGWSSPIGNLSYESGTQRVFSRCRISSRPYQL